MTLSPDQLFDTEGREIDLACVSDAEKWKFLDRCAWSSSLSWTPGRLKFEQSQSVVYAVKERYEGHADFDLRFVDIHQNGSHPNAFIKFDDSQNWTDPARWTEGSPFPRYSE